MSHCLEDKKFSKGFTEQLKGQLSQGEGFLVCVSGVFMSCPVVEDLAPVVSAVQFLFGKRGSSIRVFTMGLEKSGVFRDDGQLLVGKIEEKFPKRGTS